jgi:hypothetical protein
MAKTPNKPLRLIVAQFFICCISLVLARVSTMGAGSSVADSQNLSLGTAVMLYISAVTMIIYIAIFATVVHFNKSQTVSSIMYWIGFALGIICFGYTGIIEYSSLMLK